MSERNPLARLDPNTIHQKLVELGERWADEHAAASFLEETQKPLLARLTLERCVGSKSRAQAETEALATPEYRQHITQMVEARRKANIARVRQQSAQVWADLLRSANANRRAEMAMGGMAP